VGDRWPPSEVFVSRIAAPRTGSEQDPVFLVIFLRTDATHGGEAHEWQAGVEVIRHFVIVVIVIVAIIYACDGGFAEANADLETYGLQRIRHNVDGELLHLVPVRPVFVVVAGALVDEEGHDDVGVDFVAHRDHFRLSVAGHDVRVGAGFAERCRTYRRSAFDVCLAHGRSSF
jgi:hypothetical protein